MDALPLPAQIGKYPIIGRLGDGATSEVFLGRDEFHQRDVAIKRVRSGAVDDPGDGRFFERFFAAEKPEVVLLAAAKVGGILANSTRPAE